MTPEIPQLVLLELRLRALKPIRRLPHYHGAQWSALFRHALKSHLPQNISMADAGVWIHPVETGVLEYEKGDLIHVGLTFPSRLADVMDKLLQNFNQLRGPSGHFMPGATVSLEKIVCRITGEIWNPSQIQYLTYELLRPEAEQLQKLDQFTILFFCPLRLKRPDSEKTQNHRFCDADFFLPAEKTPDNPLLHLIANLRFIGVIPASNQACRITGGGLDWLDVPYGSPAKTIGGVIGKITVQGCLPADTAFALAAGQYMGAGKNASFGFGFYHIAELDGIRSICNLTRGRTILDRVLSIDCLTRTIAALPRSSPGPDFIDAEDLARAGGAYLENLRLQVLAGDYRPGDLKKYKTPQDDGAFREMTVQNTTDRLLQRAAADYLIPVSENILTLSSYACRCGLNKQSAAAALQRALAEGFDHGLKADISTFFESVDPEIMASLLEGLLPFEPLVQNIVFWRRDLLLKGSAGLQRGSPLSAVLCNIYLNRFDRALASAGFRLIRYQEAFVALLPAPDADANLAKRIADRLLPLKLSLNTQKAVVVEGNAPIHFLGYLVSAGDMAEALPELYEDENNWPPLFREEVSSGAPVYLSSISRGASSSGNHLIINDADGNKTQIPWRRISRIVVVGQSAFSGGVIYRAVQESIPVSFIDVMGRLRGNFIPAEWELPEIVSLQTARADDDAWRLAFAKEIIQAKILNLRVLLMRNGRVADDLREMARAVEAATSQESLRGCEGMAAKRYFQHLADLVLPFRFAGRHFRPPDCPVNVMLSFGYTLIYNRLSFVLSQKGFNPRIGFFMPGAGPTALWPPT